MNKETLAVPLNCELLRQVVIFVSFMAEREGFEPPIPVKVWLISSQLHSTGLCHLSALLNNLKLATHNE